MTKPRIGVIGGSGLYALPGYTERERLTPQTPFGAPSDALVLLEGDAAEIVFLPRHGRGHRLAPHAIDYRANVFAMKLARVDWLVSVSAVGSLREDIAPGDFVIVDQFLDFTRGRAGSFFGEGLVAHVPMADPTCPALRTALAAAARAGGARVHECGTYICIQGPQFSARAESQLFRHWGADVIGMTNMPEAKLAREAQLCYATLAMATDYDCWREAEEAVSVEAVIEVMRANVARAIETLARLPAHLPAACDAGCRQALEHAVITAPEAIDAEHRRLLAVLRGEHP